MQHDAKLLFQKSPDLCTLSLLLYPMVLLSIAPGRAVHASVIYFLLALP